MPADAVSSIAATLASALSDHEGGIAAVLALARQHMGMDVAFVSEFADGRQVYRVIDGDGASFGLEVDDGPSTATTYCSRLVAGTIPALIGDTHAEPEVRDLEATSRARIGAYVGVPLRFSDGRLYGTFCCLSHEPDSRLARRDLAYMELLSLVLAERIETQDNQQRRRREIEDVLAAEDVDIALQPVVGVADNNIVGVEALARFPTLRLPPDIVIAQAHEVGLGIELELLAIRAALERIAVVPEHSYLSVNIGPAAMLSDNFTSTMRTCPAINRVCLEITEHASIVDYQRLHEIAAPLRTDGMLLAVDDVGAGYASLRHVLQMRPDILKIDRSLIGGIATDPGRRSIVTSIVLLAMDLQATVVAEGVETAEDRDALLDVGVDLMQGYLAARPTTDPADWQQWTTSSRTIRRRVPPPRPPRPSVIRLDHS